MNAVKKTGLQTALFSVILALCLTTSAQNTFITLTGQLKDSKTGEKIQHATVSIPDKGIGTVSNSDGEFILKVDSALRDAYFEVSHLSYATARFRITDALEKDRKFYLDLRPIQLGEISVVPAEARRIVEMAIGRIRDNYPGIPYMMTGFYRESVKHRREYLEISEAVVDIYKASYRSFQGDQVKIFKGRKNVNVKNADTLLVQLQGGPSVAMLLDIVKNTDLGIALDNLDNYRFELASLAYIDDKLNRVISFEPNVVKEDPLYFGKLYISQDQMAITRAEFSLDLGDKERASRAFVEKRPAGLIFEPTSTSYLVTYQKLNGKYSFKYVCIELKFRCDWKKRLFKNTYTLISELAVTSLSDENASRFAYQETFKPGMVFTEKVGDFADVDFWGEHNIIEPENSIENAIRKISKNLGK